MCFLGDDNIDEDENTSTRFCVTSDINVVSSSLAGIFNSSSIRSDGESNTRSKISFLSIDFVLGRSPALYAEGIEENGSVLSNGGVDDDDDDDEVGTTRFSTTRSMSERSFSCII